MQFVLVHGGWQSGWCRDRVARYLREMEHSVFAPTLRGPDPDMPGRAKVNLTAIGDGLIEDVERTRMSDLVFVGHSGGGPVIQYSADRLAERTRRVVFMDAAVSAPAGRTKTV